MLSFFFQVVEYYKHQNRNSIFRNQQSSFICQILRSFRIICRQTYIVFGHYMQSFNKMVNKRRKDRIPRHVKRRMCHIGVLKKNKKKPWCLIWNENTSQAKLLIFVNG